MNLFGITKKKWNVKRFYFVHINEFVGIWCVVHNVTWKTPVSSYIVYYICEINYIASDFVYGCETWQNYIKQEPNEKCLF